MPIRVGLTGASGFIGGNLLTRLNAAGHEVRALVRRPNKRQLQPDRQIQWIEGDLDDESSLRRLVHGVDQVIHCAGRVRGTSYAAFEAVNVTGTERLSRAIEDSPLCSHAILLSSLAARHPNLSSYARSKHAAEQVVNDGGDTQWTVVRPPAVYGSGDRELAPLWRSAKLGVLPVPGGANQQFSLIHIDDLCSALLSLIERPCESTTYELHDGRLGGYDWATIAETLSELLQRRVRIVRISAGMLKAVATINLGSARLLNYAPMLTPEKVRELLHPNWVCNATEPHVRGYVSRVAPEPQKNIVTRISKQ